MKSDVEDEIPRILLREDRLIVGDIICIGANTAQSRRIREETGGGPVSHVAVYLGRGLIAEAIVPRGRIETVHQLGTSPNISTISVMRPKRDVIQFSKSPREAHLLVNEAFYYSSSLYSLFKALGFKLLPLRYLAARDAVICSELVVRAYSRIGIELCPNLPPYSISPNDIFLSDKLFNVTKSCTFKGESNDSLEPAGGASHPRVIPSLLQWLSAILRAISPSRRAWAKPREQWTSRDYWSYYAMHAIGIFRRRVQMWFLGRIYYSAVERDFYQRTDAAFALAEARKIRFVVLLVHADVTGAEYKSIPPPWGLRLRNQERVELAIQLRYLRYLKKIHAAGGGSSENEAQFHVTLRSKRPRRKRRARTKARNKWGQNKWVE